MISTARLRVAIFLVLVIAVSQIISQRAVVDKLTLFNGHRMTETLVREEDGIVVFKTAYTGEIKVELKHVVRIRTDEPMQIRTYDETIYSTNEIESLMKKLGKYKTRKSCLYVKSLDDIDRKVLARLIERSVVGMKKIYEST